MSTGRMSTGRTSTGRMSTGRMSTRAAKRRRAGAQAQGAQVQPHARRRLRARDAPARSRAPYSSPLPGSPLRQPMLAGYPCPVEGVWKHPSCSVRVAGQYGSGFSSSKFFQSSSGSAACAENQKEPHSKRVKSRVCDNFQTFQGLPHLETF